MSNIFKSILVNKPKQNKFNLSHEKKMSLNMGKLYPILVQEVIPGDKFKVNTEILTRLAPMVAPVMHRINVKTEYFFVPNRLVWNEWEDFITGGEDGNQNPVFPTISINDANNNWFTERNLPDYMGIPTTLYQAQPGQDNKISALPFRAYQKIYNEFYRDQNLEPKVDFNINSGSVPDAEVQELTMLRTRAWEKDYFTSALPWAQRGGEASVPLGTVQPQYKQFSSVYRGDGSDPVTGNMTATDTNLILDTNNSQLRIENLEPMSVDAVTINDLRKAEKLQKWLESSARGGSRYIEQMLVKFGVRSSDARLQRPEFLGGSVAPISISETLSTADIGIIPQGNMAGHGVSMANNRGFKKSFEEHGFIIGLVSVLPKTAYQQGIERSWLKFDKFDYYWREFAHLGEQEIMQQEIYFDPSKSPTANAETFGYQQRYAEYKYKQSQVAGEFRTSLNFWHMGRFFTNKPVLNEAFIQSDPARWIFAVEDNSVDTIYMQVYNNISALRSMPYHSIPSL